PQPCSIEALAEQIAELFKYLHISKASIVAHSLGGYVSLALAEKYPEMIEKLCLFHSTALADSPEKQHTRNKVIDFVQKVGVNQYIESFVSPLFYAKRLSELSEKVKFLEEIGKKTPLNTILEVVAAMRDRKDRIEVIKNAHFPILYIIGKEDGAVSFESYQEQLKVNPKIESLILEETGHMGMFERPQETLQALKNFIQN
ncbi:MAG: alpha/beta fold hydrolase, partial [Raineya sp.]